MKKINYKQTLKYLKGSVSPVFFGSVQWKQTVDLFNKSIPMKPLNQKVNHNGLKIGTCNCKVYVSNDCIGNTVIDETFDFCKKCGQALDWSNE